MSTIEDILSEIDNALPEQLRDGTYADGDYETAEGLYTAETIIRRLTVGMVLVPAEPTEERVRVLMRGWDSIGSHTMYENYRDMVALGEGK